MLRDQGILMVIGSSSADDAVCGWCGHDYDGWHPDRSLSRFGMIGSIIFAVHAVARSSATFTCVHSGKGLFRRLFG